MVRIQGHVAVEHLYIGIVAFPKIDELILLLSRKRNQIDEWDLLHTFQPKVVSIDGEGYGEV